MKNRANDADALTVKDEAGIGNPAAAVKPDEFREPLRGTEMRAVSVIGSVRHPAGLA